MCRNSTDGHKSQYVQFSDVIVMLAENMRRVEV
jgi:hypothetical protein